MPEEGFLRRWARIKATGDDAAPEAPQAPAPRAAPATARWARAGDVPPAAPVESGDAGLAGDASAPAGRRSPTLEDVARLTPDSDYSIFVGQGVDKSVQRLALKKLFADPHFNVMDRLDMYMDDYNIPSPVSEEMLASLDHARSALRRFVEEPAAIAPGPGEGDAVAETLESAKSAGPAAPQAPAPDVVEPEAVLHDDAAHAPAAREAAAHGADTHEAAAHEAAAHEYSVPADTTCTAPAHAHGPIHRPNQQLPQGQA